MTDLAVVGPDPRFGGGGSAQVEAFLAGARELGRSPELLSAPHPTLAGTRLSIDRVEALRQLRWARRLAPAVRAATSAWVASPIATHGLAAARSGRSYGCWLGTTLDDEWAARAPALDRGRRLAQRLNAPFLRPVERRVIGGAARVYATSPASRRAIAAAGDRAEDELGILPIPVDLTLFHPGADEEWVARLERPTVVFVGRADDPRKNVALLLRAWTHVLAHVPEARLRLVGRPPAGPLPAGAEAAGEVESVAAELRRASLFVLPSRQEGFGIAVAEALACGVPAVVTPCGGPEELVRESGAGKVAADFEPETLAEALAAALGDRSRLVQQRARGRSYVELHHSPERFRTELAAALAEVDDA